MKNPLFLLLLLALFCGSNLMGQDIHEVATTQQCVGLTTNQKVRLSVSSFDVSTISNPGRFGDELAQMLTNSLQNTGCFNVLLSIKDMKGLENEAALNQTGAVSSPEASGQLKDAQVIVIGKVVEYRNPENAGSPGGNNSITVSDNAHIGFIIQLINASTREIIDSKQFSVDGKKIVNVHSFLKGLKLDSKSNGNKSFEDAKSKGIIEAVEYIASRKDQMPLPAANSGTYEAKTYTAANCAVLRSAYTPKIMVIIPEFHLTQRIPDPSGETEINRRLVEAGFRVVDPALYAAIQKTMEFDEAAKDPMKAISLGKKFGADIVIYGEAFSELAGRLGSQISCRARVEVRAVRTDDATIIATNGLEAGAVDIAEYVAAKSALRKAGTLVADYMLTQFCTKDISFSAPKRPVVQTKGVGLSHVEIIVSNTDYSGLKLLAEAISEKGTVLERSINSGKGNIKLQYKGSINSITDYIDAKLGAKYSITAVGAGKISLLTK